MLLMTALLCDLGVHLFHCFEDLSLDNWYDALDQEVDDLSCHSEVDDLLLEPIGIHLESLGFHLTVRSETLGRDLEDVKIWHQNFRKGDIDECSQEDWKVGGNEVDDKDLLNKGSLVCCILCQRIKHRI